MAKQAGFGKKEKLKSRKLVEDVFAMGKSFNVFPIRVAYKFLSAQPEDTPMQAGVSVSKKNFKRAVDRNRIKRLLREAYRLQKKELLELLEEKKVRGYAFFIYTDKNLPDYKIVFASMTKCLESLKRKAIVTSENHS